MHIQQYLEDLGTETESTETLRAYRQDLERFDGFLREKNLRVDEVKPSDIKEYQAYLATNKGRTVSTTLSPSTIARRLAVVSSYYDWCQRNSDEPVINPVIRVKRPKVQNVLRRAVDDAILAKLVDGVTDVRDRAIVLLFLYSGLRLDELRQTDKTTLTLTKKKQPDGSFQYFGSGEVIGKGSKPRSFLVGPKAMQAVATYLTQQRMKDDLPPLFLSSRKTRLSSRAIQQVVNKWCVRLGVPHIHVHQFRHSFATRNVNAGMSAVVLQELMGHANLNTTQRYFGIKPERLSREYFSVMEFVRQFSPV
ncbi:MAG: tyrosine-type recombinase/integrase [Acidobacteriaceae bacterium]|jgi:site-specific recombinase XerD